MKKLINSILKHFSLQLVKRPKQRKRGWKQQGRGIRVTVSSASDLHDMSKIILLASTAPTRLESQAPTNQILDNIKRHKIPKEVFNKIEVPVWGKDK